MSQKVMPRVGRSAIAIVAPRRATNWCDWSALWIAIAVALSLVWICSSPAPAYSQEGLGEQLAKDPSWKVPTEDEVRGKVLTWLDQAGLSPEARHRAEALWPVQLPVDAQPVSHAELLALVVEVIAAVDPNAAELVELTSTTHPLGP